MREYPLSIYIKCDKKICHIIPCVQRKHDGVGIAAYVTSSLPFASRSDGELGKAVAGGFDYILRKYENDEDIDEAVTKQIPWKKRGNVHIIRYKSGEYKISIDYINHEIMTTNTAAVRKYPADISVEELGKAVRSAIELALDYMNRQEITVYHSDQEGLLFVPNAVGNTGYVLSDRCIRVLPPYIPEDIRAAAKEAFDYAAANPADKRTKKERKENLPWREFSKYKSFRGFVKSHHCVEMHRLTDGRLVFIPTLRIDTYESLFAECDAIRIVRSGGISDEKFKEELFAAFELCRLIYEKDKEPDTVKCEGFFEYIGELAGQLESEEL
ncbi:MAG: hypothetical protein NC120_11420 [Ruminococcus sp.]|nr:hypothetical protein [Ruminococcus sp.]